MKVAFDIDNTIVNNGEIIFKYLQEFGISEDDLKNLKEYKKEEFLDKYLENIFLNANIFDGVKETFSYLNKNNHKIYLVTRRSTMESLEIEKITKNYFKKHNLVYDDIFFRVLEKGKLCKKKNIPILFDDQIFNLEDCKKHGVKGVKYGVDAVDDYPHVKDWTEVLEFLKKEGY